MRRQQRILFVVAAVAAVLGCLLVFRGRGAPPRVDPSSGAPSSSAVSPASTAGAEVAPEVTTLPDDDGFRVLVFLVPLAGARFRVVDMGMTADLSRVLEETSASLVVNGGFFDKAQRPEGLVISEGAVLSPRSDTLGGGVVAVGGGRGALAAAEGFVAAPGTDFAIQARPRLVVDGVSGIVKDDGRAAERTALCLREQGRTLEIVVARGEAAGHGPTLALLADMLVSRGCTGALNLDGGPSTGIAWREDGRTRALSPRGSLRHAIAVWAAASAE
jgi:uncharacterized protein YigE (DUF2233 family)